MVAGLCAVAGLGAAAGSANAGTSFSFSFGSGHGGGGPRHGLGFSSHVGYSSYGTSGLYYPGPVAYGPPVTYCAPPVVYVRPSSHGYYGHGGGYRGHDRHPGYRGYSNSLYGGYSGFGVGLSLSSAQSDYRASEPVSTPDRPYYGESSRGEEQRFTSSFQTTPQRVEPISAETVRAVAATQRADRAGMSPQRTSSDAVMASLAQNASGTRPAPVVSVQPVARVMPVASGSPVVPVRTLSVAAVLPVKSVAAQAAPAAAAPVAKPAPATVAPQAPARFVAAAGR